MLSHVFGVQNAPRTRNRRSDRPHVFSILLRTRDRYENGMLHLPMHDTFTDDLDSLLAADSFQQSRLPGVIHMRLDCAGRGRSEPTQVFF